MRVQKVQSTGNTISRRRRIARRLLQNKTAMTGMSLLMVFVILAVLTLMTLLKPLPQPVTLPVNTSMDMTTDPRTKIFGGVVVLLTLILYAIFW